MTQRPARSASHVSGSPLPPIEFEKGADPVAKLVVALGDEHAGHRRPRHLRRVAANCRAGRVEALERLAGARRGRGADVHLVRVARDECRHARAATPADDHVGMPSPFGSGWLGIEAGIGHGPVPALVAPTVGLGPQAVQDRELVLQHLETNAGVRIRNAMTLVLELVPSSAETHLDPSAAHLGDRGDHLREIAGHPERDR